MFGWFSRKHADFQGYVIVYGDKRVTSVTQEDKPFHAYKWDDTVCVGEINGSATWEDLKGNKIPNPHLDKFPTRPDYIPQRYTGRYV